MSKTKQIVQKVTVAMMLFASVVTVIPFIALIVDAIVNFEDSIVFGSIEFIFSRFEL